MNTYIFVITYKDKNDNTNSFQYELYSDCLVHAKFKVKAFMDAEITIWKGSFKSELIKVSEPFITNSPTTQGE